MSVKAGSDEARAGEARRPYVGSQGARNKTPRFLPGRYDIDLTKASRKREKTGNPARDR
jgi:hypothetical protein